MGNKCSNPDLRESQTTLCLGRSQLVILEHLSCLLELGAENSEKSLTQLNICRLEQHEVQLILRT